MRLVAGEDARYTLTGPGLDAWLPALLGRLTGARSLEELLAALPEELRGPGQQVLLRLYGERVLVDGPPEAAQAHRGRRHRLVLEGQHEWLGWQQGPAGPEAAPVVRVLCQDRLDYAAALSWNRSCLAGDAPWLWVSCGALGRGYVGPLFLPAAGPCLRCLLSHFQRLSPAPEIYDDLIAHAERGGEVAPVTFPAEAAGVLKHLVRWKVDLAAQAEPPSALYRLHVLSVDSLEISGHRVYRDPECPDCSGHR